MSVCGEGGRLGKRKQTKDLPAYHLLQRARGTVNGRVRALQLHPDQVSTPAHIVPEWYFWPFYAILRAFTQDFFFIPAKLMGVLAMFGAILVWFFLPWLDRSPVRSGNYRPLYRKFFLFGLINNGT